MTDDDFDDDDPQTTQTQTRTDDGPPDLKKKVDEFRSSNRELRSLNRKLEERIAAMEAEQAKMGDLRDKDPNQLKSALDLLSRVEDQAEAELIQAGRFDEVIARRLKPREEQYQRELQAREKKLEAISANEKKAMSLASRMLLERQLRQAISGKKLRPHSTAEEDLMARFQRDWKMPEDLEGNPVPAHPNNIAESVEAWIDQQVEKAPHLWEGGTGGGAKGAGKLGADGVRTVRRSEISDRDYGKLAKEIAEGKVRVIQ